MAGSPNQKKQFMSPSFCTIKFDFIKEYKLSSNRGRDILWMKHRNLRKIFDEIERKK